MDAMELEQAICPHMRKTRTLPKSTPDNYNPPFPAFSARFPKSSDEEMVMVVIGAQAFQGLVEADAFHFVQNGLNTSPSTCGPKHYDVCTFQDHFGKHNVCLIIYWKCREEYEEWKTVSNFVDWWGSQDREKDEVHGWFLEEFFPSMDRLETVFSDRQMKEGFSTMEEGKSDAILEHAYWGSMRDRLPVGQNDVVACGTEDGQAHSLDERPARPSIVSGRMAGGTRSNLCLIRSGQDWSKLEGKERSMYLDTIHPVLIDGMSFLRDQGDQVGCFDCRFMQVVDEDDLTPTERTFGLAYFCDLAHLEAWAKDHPTHLNIFGKFLQYASDLQNDVHLRLYHDVLILKSDQQRFEYINCHAASGMLGK